MPQILTEPLILEVHPDTGHQFFTRPLGDLIQKREQQKDLNIYAQWGSRQFIPWDSSHPWLRYRFHIIGDKPFITFAVESNLGHWSRGTLYKVDPCQPDPELPFYMPYAKEHLKDPIRGHSEKVTSFTFKYVKRNERGEESEVDISCDVDLQINFLRRTGTPICVDLVVDLGNSRTAAVLLEAPGDGRNSSFSSRLQVLEIGVRGMESTADHQLESGSALRSESQSMVDSWFLLHEPLFAHLEPGYPTEDGSEPENVIRKASERTIESANESAWYMEYHNPHAFVELSPALIGGGKSPEGAGKVFAGQKLDRDYPFFLSSPKRYVCSQSRRGVAKGSAFWFQIPNKKTIEDFVELRGLIRYFMSTDGHDLDTDPQSLDIKQESDPGKFQTFVHNAPPTYSASDSVCWFALALIEAAYRRINTSEYLARTQAATNTLRRRLRYIRVTCPSGWTFMERDLYFRQWQRAINLFTMSRFANWKTVPMGELPVEAEAGQPVLCAENLDEAVCSQLPILYAEIQSLGGQARKWIELYGDGSKVTVMNLDVGGGTTDLAVIEYKVDETNAETRLKPNLLFRDGYPIAGDMVVKRIIERILIPAWFEESAKAQQSPVLQQARNELEVLFHQPRNARIANVGGKAASASKNIARAIRLIFMPLANQLLRGLCNPTSADNDSRRASLNSNIRLLNIQDCLGDGIIPMQVLDDINLMCSQIIRFYYGGDGWDLQDKVFSDTVVLKCDLQAVDQCIYDVFGPFFGGLSSLAPRYNPDLLIISGKPSELPRVNELIRHSFPILPQRIISVKNYPAGHWYPSEFATVDEGRITDAKTCTVVGAALYQDFQENHSGSFNVILEGVQAFQKPAYWGTIPRQGYSDTGFDKEIIKPNLYKLPDFGSTDDSNQVEIICKNTPIKLNLAIPHRIGRRLVDDPNVRPAPVYMLRWERLGQTNMGPVIEAEIVFRWVCIRGKGDKLEIESVTPLGGAPFVSPGEIKLELNTLVSESDGEDCEFWLDEPKLLVNLTPVQGKGSIR